MANEGGDDFIVFNEGGFGFSFKFGGDIIGLADDDCDCCFVVRLNAVICFGWEESTAAIFPDPDRLRCWIIDDDEEGTFVDPVDEGN